MAAYEKESVTGLKRIVILIQNNLLSRIPIRICNYLVGRIRIQVGKKIVSGP